LSDKQREPHESWKPEHRNVKPIPACVFEHISAADDRD